MERDAGGGKAWSSVTKMITPASGSPTALGRRTMGEKEAKGRGRGGEYSVGGAGVGDTREV